MYFLIFGAGGDLTKHKLMPALFNRAAQNLLPERFAVVGVDRVAFDNGGFRAYPGSEVRSLLGSEPNAERGGSCCSAPVTSKVISAISTPT